MNDAGRRRWPKVLGIVVGVFLVVFAAGVLALDRILLAVARTQAAALSKRLSRPISVTGVGVKLWGGFGVKVSGLSVGPGPGEVAKLLELGRAEVTVGVLRALVSGGREIAIPEAVVEGLRVNVEKLANGSTNLENLARQLGEESGGPDRTKAGPRPNAPEEPRRPPALEVGRAALLDARIAFIDRTVRGAKEIFVDHLDVEVKDLGVEKPLEIVVKAAVLSDRQNLEVRVKTAPLPASLTPVPEELTLRAQPIDLEPIAPFLPASVGLRGGRLEADLKAALGAAVPGGSGETRVVGNVRATQLAFAGQAGGKRLDLSLDADLTARLKEGDLDIRKLELVLGPAALSGHGRVTGILGSSPRVEGIEITSRGLDPLALSEYYPPLRKEMGGAVFSGPLGISLSGQGTAGAQRLELRVDLTPVRLEVPQKLAKAAGAPMTVGAGLDAAESGGRIGFDVNVDLAGVDLRPGGSIAKKPGEPLGAKVSGMYQKTASGLEVAISQLSLNLLGDPLSGKGKVVLAGTPKSRATRFDAEVSGDRLDLDRLLMKGPGEKPGVAAKAAEPGKSSAADSLAGLSGVARLKLGLLRVKGVDAHDVLARVKVADGAVTLEEAELKAFGGSVDAAGTTASLAHPGEPFKVVTKLKGVAVEKALELLSSRKVLSGDLDADLTLSGPSLARGDLAKALTGSVKGTLRSGVFHSKDLVAAAAAPLSGKLPFVRKVSEGGDTPLGKELPFALQVADGVAQLEKPVRFDTGEGQVELGGGVGLDGMLHMPSTVALSPDFVARLTGGKVKPSGPVPLGFTLAGPVASPRLEGLTVDAAAKSLALQAAGNALGKALGVGDGSGGAAKAGNASSPTKQLEDEAAKRLKGLFGK